MPNNDFRVLRERFGSSNQTLKNEEDKVIISNIIITMIRTFDLKTNISS